MSLVDKIISAESGGNPNASSCAFPHMGDKFGADALVSKLHFSSRPPAVLRAVISIVIDPIKGVFFAGAMSHVGKEILKTGRPSVTNFDASSAVVFVRSVFWQFASTLHAVPYLIFCRSFAPTGDGNRHPMRGVGDFCHLNLVATTARCVPGLEVRDQNGNDVSAVTPARHSPDSRWSSFSKLWLSLSKSKQPTKFKTDIVYAFAWGQ